MNAALSCSPVPQRRMVGPTSVSPNQSARSGALAQAELLGQHQALQLGQAPAAVLSGPGCADPARRVELLVPLLAELLAVLGRLLAGLVGPSVGQVGESQARTLARNPAASPS